MAIAYNPTNGLSFENLSKKDSFGKDIIFDLLGKSVYAKGTLVGKVYQEFQKSTSSTTGLSGLVPFPDYNGNSKTRFLREDGTWVVPTNTNNYRPISINGTPILDNNNTVLNLVAGNNITLSPKKDSNNKYTGEVTITANAIGIKDLSGTSFSTYLKSSITYGYNSDETKKDNIVGDFGIFNMQTSSYTESNHFYFRQFRGQAGIDKLYTRLYYKRENEDIKYTDWKEILKLGDYTTLSGYGITDAVKWIGEVNADSVYGASVGYNTDSAAPYKSGFINVGKGYGFLLQGRYGKHLIYRGFVPHTDSTSENPKNTFEAWKYILDENGGELKGALTLQNSQYSGIKNSEGNIILGAGNSSAFVGAVDDVTTIVGTSLRPTVLRTSENNLWHYRGDKSSKYLILDTANASSHVVDLTSNQTISGEKTFSNLKVNNTNLVTNLNAEMVGGKPLDKLFAERGSIPLNDDKAYDYNKALIAGGYNTVSFADVDNIVNAPFSNYGTLLYVTGKGDTWMQLASEYNRTSLYVRSGNIRNSEVYTVTNWKKVAFTDSNITGNAATASALIRNTMPADANDLFDGRSPNQLLFFSEFSSATKNLPEEIGYDTALLHIGRYNSGTASQLYFGRSGNIHYRSSASGWKKIFFDNSNSLTPSGGTLTVDGNLITNKVASKSLVSFIGNDNTERIALQNNSSNDLLIGGGYTDKTVYLDANIFRSRANTTVLGGKVGIGTSSPTEKLQVNGNVKATSFLGNLDGSYINKLTGYTKATTISAITVNDSLNTALGKLEFKTDFIYNDLFGTDNDDIINKWHEIVDFVDSVAENTDITDEFVTRKTTQTITGAKTFSEKLIIESGHDAKLILNNTDTENKYLQIVFKLNGEEYGRLGTYYSDVLQWSNNIILHSGNTHINNGIITINGNTITPLTTGYIGTTQILTTSKIQALTGITSLSISDNINILSGNSDRYITFGYSNDAFTSADAYSWRLGYIGSGEGNANYFKIQSSHGNTWTDVLKLGLLTYEATFSGNVIASGNVTASGDIILKNSGINAATPYLKFQRGSINDSYIDWRLGSTNNGKLILQYNINESNATTETWNDVFVTTRTVSTFNSALEVAGSLLTLGNSNGSTLIFKRPNANYIWTDEPGGYFTIGVKDTGSTSTDNASLLITKEFVQPGRRNNAVYLGHSSYRWANVFSVLGNFSGNVTASKFITTGGTASQFVKGDGSLDSTSYVTTTTLENYVTKTEFPNLSSKGLYTILTSSSSSNINKWKKFARINLSSDRVYTQCGGYMFIYDHEGHRVKGILDFHVRTEPDTSINNSNINLQYPYLKWHILDNSNYASNIKMVKVENGIFDLYITTLQTYTTLVILVFTPKSDKITLFDETWIDTLPENVICTSSYTITVPNATTATKLANTLTFSAGNFTSKTYNGSSAVTVNIPTHTSHLTNDSFAVHNPTVKNVTSLTRSTLGYAYNAGENADTFWYTAGPVALFGNSKYLCAIQADASNNTVIRFRKVVNKTAQENWRTFVNSDGTQIGSSVRPVYVKNDGSVAPFTLSNATANDTRNILVGYDNGIYLVTSAKINPSTGILIANGFVKSGSTDSHVLLGAGGHKAISDFVLKSEFDVQELSSNLTTITIKSLAVTTDWMDTGIIGSYKNESNTLVSGDLETGTYIVQVYCSGAKSGGTSKFYNCYWSGVMSWYSGTNSTNSLGEDEILLHRSGHADNNCTIYLRTKLLSGSKGLKLLIAANQAMDGAEYTFKFKRVI